ncbi:hypothetical protein [Neosynechococcus sphagnicola]|uniref:hypothetical protein n=1 Tax=Neosynechococcus sphagnicola TaxID=1501145 RepID=UPI003B833C73
MPLFRLNAQAISLASVSLLFLQLLLVWIVVRAVREWLKRGLLSRLGIDRGTRDAIARVFSYLLIALGFVIVLQTAGIDLSSLTVLAGVFGIAFGLGLQNLASNFIRGGGTLGGASHQGGGFH